MNIHIKTISTRRPLLLMSILSSTAIILSACATATPTTQAQPNSLPSNSTSGSAASINVATDATLGKILVDGKGMTLYIFTKDGPDKSNCDASCLANWPALLTAGDPTLGAGVDASLVGSAALSDGTKIVPYNQQPLY